MVCISIRVLLSYKMTSLPSEAEVFACRVVPGCLHGHQYACTPRKEVRQCFKDLSATHMASRGACKRACHFERLCESYVWHVAYGRGVCTLCHLVDSEEDRSTTWKFSTGKQFVDQRIVEWHHGWHTSAIMSAWTGKIDLVLEGYISPRPMALEETHILMYVSFIKFVHNSK